MSQKDYDEDLEVSKKIFIENLNLTSTLVEFFDLNNISPNRALDIIACYLAARWVEDEDFYDTLTHLPVVIGQVRDVLLDVQDSEENS